MYTDLAFATSYWTRYLSVYREVKVFARVTEQPRVPESYVRADDHPSVVFVSAGGFRGPRQLVTALPSLLLRAARVVRETEVALVRNGVVSTAMWVFLVISRRPYGKEVQGEIGESVKLTVSGAPWAAGRLASLSDWLTRAQTRRAAAVAYVTPVLSRQYPPSRRAVVVHYSSVGLPARPEIPSRDRTHQFRDPATLVSVGRLEREKGHDVLIKALAYLRDEEGLHVLLRLVGDGSQRSALEALAGSLKLSARSGLHRAGAPGLGGAP